MDSIRHRKEHLFQPCCWSTSAKKKPSQCKRTENKMQTEHLTASFELADLLSVILTAITLLLDGTNTKQHPGPWTH